MLREFIRQHQLSSNFKVSVDSYYQPLCEKIKTYRDQAEKPLFIGINGCQGSGKSTLAAFIREYLAFHYQLNIVVVSLDDFYLNQTKRSELAQTVHPLLVTRGVPSTHDTTQLKAFLKQLRLNTGKICIPRFNKATDNPLPKNQWPVTSAPVDIVILEGWCWGVNEQTQQQLEPPVNQLEREKDPDGLWRYYINQQLAEHYQPLYRHFDYWLMLKAPSFDNVYAWRLEQEKKLKRQTVANQGHGIMSSEQIKAFIQHYQRLTEHALTTLPKRCDHVYELDSKRNIVQHLEK